MLCYLRNHGKRVGNTNICVDVTLIVTEDVILMTNKIGFFNDERGNFHLSSSHSILEQNSGKKIIQKAKFKEWRQRKKSHGKPHENNSQIFFIHFFSLFPFFCLQAIQYRAEKKVSNIIHEIVEKKKRK